MFCVCFMSAYLKCPNCTTRVVFGTIANFTVVTHERTWVDQRTCLPQGRSSYVNCSIMPVNGIERTCSMFSNSITLANVVIMLLFFRSWIVSYDLLSLRVPCCVCDTLSSRCGLTVFPVEQNKPPQPQGFLMSKHRPLRIILINCGVPKVVL